MWVNTKNLPDLSMRQLAVLLVIHTADEPQTVRSLASILDVHKPAVTRALDKLSDHGLLRRLPDPADKRSILVELTKRGTALARSLSRASAASQATARGRKLRFCGYHFASLALLKADQQCKLCTRYGQRSLCSRKGQLRGIEDG